MSWEDILKQENIPNRGNMSRELETMQVILSHLHPPNPQMIRLYLPKIKGCLKRLELLVGK
tara:strand:+ start:90 stop:272 length:183 start_codon:yes stop_codon:yes gene_type:complete